jgi:uncharacterized protein
MTDEIALLLPPSEGKAAGGDGPGWDPADGRFGALAPERLAVARLLAAHMAGPDDVVGKLLGVGGRHLERARAADAAVVGAPTLPARQRYEGVVHAHIGPETLDPVATARAVEEVVVVSGLLGLAGWDDPLPDYRLKMGARLGELGRLSRWWRPTIAEQLRPIVEERLVIDLLPGEHADAWEHDHPNRLRVRFEEVAASGRARRASGHAAKAVKGRLARHLLSRSGDPLDALADFAAEGWVFDEERSVLRAASRTAGDAVYVRNV